MNEVIIDIRVAFKSRQQKNHLNKQGSKPKLKELQKELKNELFVEIKKNTMN